MHIMYVCTGNQCRSVIGEYYTRGAINYWLGPEANITVSSAGTLQYPPHPADPKVVSLLRSNGLDATIHRSTALTYELIEQSDLILCFEQEHLNKLAEKNPSAVHKSFLFNQFAYTCAYMASQGTINGSDPVSKLSMIMSNAPLVRPFLPVTSETEDPHGKSDAVFHTVYAQITGGINTFVKALQ